MHQLKNSKSLNLLLFFFTLLFLFYLVPFDVNMFIQAVLMISVFAISQILHEYGHYLSHFLHNRNPKITYNKIKLPTEVTATDTKERPFTKKEIIIASAVGIFAGVIPIDIYFYLTKNILNTLIINMFYVYASRHDIMDIRNYLKEGIRYD